MSSTQLRLDVREEKPVTRGQVRRVGRVGHQLHSILGQNIQSQQMCERWRCHGEGAVLGGHFVGASQTLPETLGEDKLQRTILRLQFDVPREEL